LDLELLHGEVVAAEKVRFRKDANRGSAAETAGRDKQRKVILATQQLLKTHAELRRKPLCFDVVAVTGEGEDLAVEWIQDAFQPG